MLNRILNSIFIATAVFYAGGQVSAENHENTKFRLECRSEKIISNSDYEWNLSYYLDVIQRDALEAFDLQIASIPSSYSVSVEVLAKAAKQSGLSSRQVHIEAAEFNHVESNVSILAEAEAIFDITLRILVLRSKDIVTQCVQTIRNG